jgi:RNA polymerase sigma-70 factor (ECF subfamily)
MDDLQAIRRLKSGDISGLETLIDRYQAKAVRTAYLVTHHEPMAEDVVQDTFVRFYERIRHFDQARPFEPYFLCCVVNAALNAIGREKSMVGLTEDMDTAGLETLLARAVSVEEQVQFSQLKGEILEALGRLSPRQRTAVVQRYYLEMSEKEMAKALGAAPGTVKWLLNTARSRLRALLRSERIAE